MKHDEYEQYLGWKLPSVAKLRVRNLIEKRVIEDRNFHGTAITGIRFFPQAPDTFVCADDEGWLSLFKVSIAGSRVLTDGQWRHGIRRSFMAHWNGIVSLSMDKTGRRMATSGHDARVKLWDTESALSGKQCEVRTISDHACIVLSCDLDWEGQTLATLGVDGSVRIWHETQERPIRTFSVGRSECVRFHSGQSNLVWTAGKDGVNLWDLRMVQKKVNSTPNNARIDSNRPTTSASTSRSAQRERASDAPGEKPDDERRYSWLFGGWTGTERNTNNRDNTANNGGETSECDNNDAGNRSLKAFGSARRGGRNGASCVYYYGGSTTPEKISRCYCSNTCYHSRFNSQTKQYECQFTDHTAPVYDVTPLSSGVRVATTSMDGTIKIWTAEGVGRGTCISEMHGNNRRPKSHPLTPPVEMRDGLLLAGNSTGSLLVWNVDGVERQMHYPPRKNVLAYTGGGASRITALHVNSDESIVATGDLKGHLVVRC